MAKKDNLPKTVAENATAANTISYAPEVVGIIVGVAANEVEGVAGMCSVSGGIRSRNKNITKGVKVEVGSEEVSCDLYLNIEYGRPIQKVCHDVQESVRKALEAMTGLHVVRVDVHVQGVSFEKENNAITAGAQKAALAEDNTTSAAEEQPKEEIKSVEETGSADEPVAADTPLEEASVEAEDKPEEKAEAADDAQ